jgi:transposase
MKKRQYKQGIHREQGYLLPPSVEEYVQADNPVRAIDSYVESLDLAKMKFRYAEGPLTVGQPAYAPGSLLKLYLYGYLHRLRSSRQLEAECGRNLEVIWLLQGLKPSYKTIADFRKDNLKALKQVNQDFVQVCKELDLFGAELVGIDGSFFRGNVSREHIFTAEQLKRSLERIEESISHYLEELNQVDQAEEQMTAKTEDLQGKLAQLRERQAKRKEQAQQLQTSGETQLAEIDEDARLLRKGGQCVAGYNVQTAVDAKHKLIVAGAVTQDGNDSQQAVPMALAAKQALGVEQLETVQDQGYFNGQQIQDCLENGITPYMPEPARKDEKAKPDRILRRDFQYDPTTDRYTCPNGKQLLYKYEINDNGRIYRAYLSAPKVCAVCPLKANCLSAKARYRTVTRGAYEDVYAAHRERMETKGAEMMRKRSELCEHPFGTLKRWCGWTHFLLRGLEKVRTEWALMMLSYNFKRVLSICGIAAFRAYCTTRTQQRTPISC